MSILPGVLKSLFHPPGGDLPADADERDDFWLNWGFTIYRTAYGGEHGWVRRRPPTPSGRLLGCGRCSGSTPTQTRPGWTVQATTACASSTRSGEPSGENGKPPVMHGAAPKRRHFLVADARVLENAGNGRFWARCVQADYDPDDYASRNPRFFVGQYFFGWMQMTTRSILELWSDLATRDLDQIAPKSSDPERKDALLYDGQLTDS
ncbi:hypothetical protein MAPG_00174 [Magnaporthiopsis poae ATCC 64411]|uniref:Uncharacterized protein n=1 Tax=Magnaporthiopsis poae (strain ATCC 64411 / 73-15) TaxID=644358 RepID=A0A0C4DKA8_MAGP6|nr:hypothetical protein MAPG_00174 [Magnaporthiopsis poae ATCC 64411]